MIKHTVRHVKFSPEEMVYDPSPEETERWPVVARGVEEWRHFVSFKRGYVRLEADIAKFYPDAKTVNSILRKFMEAEAAFHASR